MGGASSDGGLQVEEQTQQGGAHGEPLLYTCPSHPSQPLSDPSTFPCRKSEGCARLALEPCFGEPVLLLHHTLRVTQTRGLQVPSSLERSSKQR